MDPNNQSKWISIDEKVPVVNQQVWYFYQYAGVFWGLYKGLCLFFEKYGEHEFFCAEKGWGSLIGDVTHWMPYQPLRPYKPILTPEDYQHALKLADKLMSGNLDKNSKEGQRLEALTIEIENYEKCTFSI